MPEQTVTVEAAAPAMPETIVINGVIYARQADWPDEMVNRIKAYQQIAKRTGLTLRQVLWFENQSFAGGTLPD